MKLRVNQLSEKLTQTLAPIYLLHGDEPLLINECYSQIAQAAIAQGFPSPQRLDVTAQFNWPELSEKFNALDLFSSKIFIKLTLANGKPGKIGSQVIIDYLKQAHDDSLLVILCNKLEASSLNSAWFKAIEKQGVTVQAWPLQGQELMHWLQDRFKKHQMTIDADALAIFSSKITGNLLAAQQEIEKLYLTYGGINLSTQDIEDAINDQAHFDIFNLVDAWLNNKLADYHRILKQLESQGTATTLLLWALSRDVRQLAQLAYQVDQGETINQAMQRVPAFRRPALQQHLKQHNAQYYHQCLQQCAVIDRTIKGLETGDVWHLLAKLPQLPCNI